MDPPLRLGATILVRSYGGEANQIRDGGLTIICARKLQWQSCLANKWEEEERHHETCIHIPKRQLDEKLTR
jgi:hypothetical protein